MALTLVVPATVSIHAPLRREERQRVERFLHLLPGVSIHAPLRREERPEVAPMLSPTCMFQSTPPSGERSDWRLMSLSMRAGWFQSTPPSGERSDA